MLIRRLKVGGLLSFGPQGIDLPLEQLNVLIGPNGSGKSNLLEVLALLKASPTNLPEPVKEMGGVKEWLWKGWFQARGVHRCSCRLCGRIHAGAPRARNHRSRRTFRGY